MNCDALTLSPRFDAARLADLPGSSAHSLAASVQDTCRALACRAAALLRSRTASPDEVQFVADLPVLGVCSSTGQPFVGHVHVAWLPSRRGSQRPDRLPGSLSRLMQRPLALDELAGRLADELLKLHPAGLAVVVQVRRMGDEPSSSRPGVFVAVRGVLRKRRSLAREVLHLMLAGRQRRDD